MLDELLARFRHKDRNALARLLTLAGQTDVQSDQLQSPPVSEKPAPVIAFTGSGGVGKSTLIGKLIDHIRSLPSPLGGKGASGLPSPSGRGVGGEGCDRLPSPLGRGVGGEGTSVAVIACDPQSPLTGGALLGDRFRMGSRLDDGVFIRSLATAPDQGALAAHLPAMIQIFRAFGFDFILLETAGAGQADTAVRKLADVLVVLLQPETGDELQWEKAGILEVADVVVVHKADLPAAQDTAAQVRGMLSLSSRPAPSIVPVSSKSGEGIAELWQAITTASVRTSS
ncbi:MAG: hypothetical protein L0215_09070 [Gemmataceae bacterium]|nr:hypothetical protein [Gemmataceae bacterium]